jgi:PleD family two-component response regulator
MALVTAGSADGSRSYMVGTDRAPALLQGLRYSAPMTGARILIIDDDEALNALLIEYLGRFGFSVRAVTHPLDGLRALKADRPICWYWT